MECTLSLQLSNHPSPSAPDPQVNRGAMADVFGWRWERNPFSRGCRPGPPRGYDVDLSCGSFMVTIKIFIMLQSLQLTH
jgi:hypothetical protein